MKFDWLLEVAHGLLLVCVIALSVLIIAMSVSGICDVVGGRAPSPSPSVSLAGDAHVTDSGAAPARSPAATTEAVSVAGGNGEDVVPVEDAVRADSQPEPASTVTQSALTATVTAYTAIDPVPATPPAQRVPVGSYEAEARAWIAVYFPPQQQATAIRVASCESRFDPTVVGRAGEQGIFQVLAQYHGTVPADIEGQVRQAAGIVARSGWSPWSCA